MSSSGFRTKDFLKVFFFVVFYYFSWICRGCWWFCNVFSYVFVVLVFLPVWMSHFYWQCFEVLILFILRLFVKLHDAKRSSRQQVMMPGTAIKSGFVFLPDFGYLETLQWGFDPLFLHPNIYIYRFFHLNSTSPINKETHTQRNTNKNPQKKRHKTLPTYPARCQRLTVVVENEIRGGWDLLLRPSLDFWRVFRLYTRGFKGSHVVWRFLST